VSAPRRFAWTAAAALAAAAVSLAGTAVAQGADIPSVDITPVHTSSHAPNDGTWFVYRIQAGGHATGLAQLSNPAHVAQTVTLFARTLSFDAAGTPSLQGAGLPDIGSWVHFAEGSVTVPAREAVRVAFTVDVPRSAEPGDHIGVLVARSQPEADGSLLLVKQVATRIDVTVPGVAVRRFEIASVTRRLDTPLWPSSLHVRVMLRNTGRIRLDPRVTVGGRPASGSPVLLAQSVEQYTAVVRVPWYGGPVRVLVRAQTAAGVQTRVVSLFVVPWALLAIVVVGLSAGAFVGTTTWRRRRLAERRRRALQDRVSELEARLAAAGRR
jgi:hypothetical protein